MSIAYLLHRVSAQGEKLLAASSDFGDVAQVANKALSEDIKNNWVKSEFRVTRCECNDGVCTMDIVPIDVEFSAMIIERQQEVAARHAS